ncbi:MAG: NUDIX hydrolase [Clostridia bacterium]
MEFMEKTLSESRVYTGRIIKVRVDEVELSDGRLTTREVIEHPGGVGVLPLDADGNVVLVSQYRYPYRAELLEIPAGKLESGEDHRICGERELSEETGCIAGRMDYLGCMYPSAGYLNEKIHMYLARDLTFAEAHPDDGEHLSVSRIPFSELLELIYNDELHDAKTIIAALKTHAILEHEGGI